MTSRKAIEEAINTVKFDKDLAAQINDKDYFEGYTEVLRKLEEAMKLMEKHNLI